MAQIRPLVYVTGDIQAIQTGDTLDPAFLGTGTRDGSRYLRDDGTWATVSGGGGVTTVINARVASTANVTISSAPAAIDGITLASGDIVLLKNQTTGAENGAYDFNGTGAAMTRNTNMGGGSSVRAGLLVTVSEGTINYDSLWMLSSNGLLTVGTDALVFLTSSVDKVIGITVDGGGAAITTGVKGYIVAGFSGTIVGWDIVANASGSIVVDVWKSGTGTIPTVANTIAGTEKPTLATQQINSDLALSTWSSTAVTKGDVIGFNVDSATTVSRVTLTLRVVS